VLPISFDYRFYERVATASGLRYFHWQCDDVQRAVNCTWEPHKKFCNIVLPQVFARAFASACLGAVLSCVVVDTAAWMWSLYSDGPIISSPSVFGLDPFATQEPILHLFERAMLELRGSSQ
jgi:hypothetical protein